MSVQNPLLLHSVPIAMAKQKKSWVDRITKYATHGMDSAEENLCAERVKSLHKSKNNFPLQIGLM